eukprot:4046530-Amphidinium_carterae.2
MARARALFENNMQRQLQNSLEQETLLSGRGRTLAPTVIDDDIEDTYGANIGGHSKKGITVCSRHLEFTAGHSATQPISLRRALGIKLMEIQVNHIAFMDDIILMAPSVANSSEMIDIIRRQLATAGLQVNETKTDRQC